MRTDLGPLLEHANADLDAFFLRQLLEPDRGRQTGRAAAHDHDVVFHQLALTVLIDQSFGGNGGSSAGKMLFSGSYCQRTSVALQPNGSSLARLFYFCGG